MRRVVLSLVVALGLLGSVVAAEPATSGASPVAGVDGVLGYATREYVASGPRFVGTTWFSFRVFLFDTPQHAQIAFPGYVGAVLGDPRDAGWREASAPTFADESVAYVGTIVASNPPGVLAVLLIRDGPLVSGWFGWGAYADPLTDLATLAQRWYAAPRPVADVLELADQLPALADMPTGFVLQSEVVGTPPP